MAYGYGVFTVLDEMLGKVLQLVPQLLWSLMLNTRTSLEATLNGNLIQAITTKPFCCHLQLKEWKPWCYLGEKSRKTAVSLFHSHLRALLHNVLSLHHCWAPPHRGSVHCFHPLVSTLQWSSHRLLYFPSLQGPQCQGARWEPPLTGLAPRAGLQPLLEVFGTLSAPCVWSCKAQSRETFLLCRSCGLKQRTAGTAVFIIS